MSSSKKFLHIDSITVFFVTGIILSNLLSSAKLVDLKISIGSFPLIFDGGLIIFPICYIFGDILTEVYGFRRSRKVIWLGFLAAILMSILVKAIQIMPGESSWNNSGGQAAYDYILFGLSSGGLVLASLSAYLVGEFVNSIVVAKMKVIYKGKFMKSRFILSTIVGQGLDTAIFFTVASLFGIFGFDLWFSLFLTNYLIKISLEVLMLPLTTKIVSYLKRVENSDYYDTNTNFNPLSFTKS